VQNDGHFTDLLLVQAGANDHLAGELHTRRLKTQSLVSILTEAAKAAVSVANRAAKEQVQNPGEDRIANVAMMPGHGPGPNAAPEAVSHHQFVTGTQALDEGIKIAEIVGVVRVAHDDVATPCCGDPCLKRTSVAALLDGNDPGAVVFGNGWRTVGAAVV